MAHLALHTLAVAAASMALGLLVGGLHARDLRLAESARAEACLLALLRNPAVDAVARSGFVALPCA